MKVLRMNTVEGARRTLSALMREYHRDEIDDAKFRTMVYGFSKLLEYFKTEKDLEIEKRLDEIEEKLGGGNAS